MMNFKNTALFGIICLGLTACGMAGDVKTEQDVGLALSQSLSLSILSGDGQTSGVGQEIPGPVTVKVADESGEAVLDEVVTFQILQGDAAFIGNSDVKTDDQGTASAQILLGDTPSQVIVSATIHPPVFIEAKHRVQFTLSGTLSSKARLIMHSDESNGQRGVVGSSLPIPLAVRAIRADGQAAVGEAIQFSVTTSTSNASVPPTVYTDSLGVATATLDVGTKSGRIEVLATWKLNNSASSTVLFYADAFSKGPSEIKLVSGHLVNGKIPCVAEGTEYGTPVMAQALDMYGNPVPYQDMRVDPDNHASVNGLALGQDYPLPGYANGEVIFHLKAGTTSSNSYDGTATIVVSAILPSGTPPSKSFTVQFTKSSLLVPEPPTATFSYGQTWAPTNLIWDFDWVIRVKALGACLAPLPAGHTISVVLEQEFNRCPSVVYSYNDFAMNLPPMVTDANGIAESTTLVRVSERQDASSNNWDETASRQTLTMSGGASLMLYAGPLSCQ